MLLDASIIPLLPKHLNPPPAGPSIPAFIVADAGPKGRGLFALRDIPAGALILAEQPLLVVPALAPPFAYDSLLPRLSPAARATLLALSNCKPPDACGAVEGIVWTNASQVDLPTPPTMAPAAREYGGVFATISRANHSCDLRTTLKWDPASFTASLYAQRAILAGEEITHQYVDVLAPRATRRAQLARYGFECMCAHCALPLAASDAAREELRTWHTRHSRFLHWATDLRAPDDALLSANTRALALIAQEGLHALQVPFLEEMALAYALLGDEARFREWAGHVVVLCAAQDPERAAEFAAWMKSPRTVRLWGWRAKQRRRGSFHSC
ncbi:hypothetical protein DFH07DRAFT_758569 [Mycena maculata]|uniref:SET domain-containing protein n=1 Tax=Mycena maculata TaxID=230809 RepID=A0AAD7HPW7_9AGAR|nr:hypothetical protein DFH07DRAFT_758569 [Mycena maculata]